MGKYFHRKSNTMRKNDIEQLEQLFMEKVVTPKEKMDIGKADLVKDGGPPKKDVDNPEETEEFSGIEEYKTKKEKKTDIKENKIMLPKSSFDSLFKSTINEQSDMVDDEEIFGDEGLEDGEFDEFGPEDDMGEEVDVATRLEMIATDLQDIISSIRGDVEEDDLDDLDGDLDDDFLDDDPMGEAKSEPEPRPQSTEGGKALAGKGKMKVPGEGHSASGGSAQSGTIKHAPEPTGMADKKGPLMGKSNKVSGRISQGKNAFKV